MLPNVCFLRYRAIAVCRRTACCGSIIVWKVISAYPILAFQFRFLLVSRCISGGTMSISHLDLKAEIDERVPDLIAMRRDLHEHPELAFEEVRTSGIVAQRLRALGLEVQTGIAKTGVVGLLRGGASKPGAKTIAIRADMDALPIHELNEIDYRSTIDGKMHACGHDGHTSILLSVADILSKRREELAGSVKFVFQPAEETI